MADRGHEHAEDGAGDHADDDADDDVARESCVFCRLLAHAVTLGRGHCPPPSFGDGERQPAAVSRTADPLREYITSR
uniref:DUF2946 family protein n=1 Tax=Microbacterium sp. SORGH_AS_1204 TaxID=3041785 RepID=UPI00359366C6